MNDEPEHDELCAREQKFFQQAIREDIDLTDHLEDVLNSMRIVLAADESFRTGRTINLSNAVSASKCPTTDVRRSQLELFT